MSKERPILFSAPMVRAILDGSKTQTRRIIAPRPQDGWKLKSCGILTCEAHKLHAQQVAVFDRLDGFTVPYKCPYGQPGDRLWVRETWQYADWTEDGYPFIRLEADGAMHLCDRIPEQWDEQLENTWAWLSSDENYKIDGRAADRRWRPSIHMPRWASRIDLEIAGVRVERLQDISEVDAIAEGIEGLEILINGRNQGRTWRDYASKCDDPCEWYSSPVNSYRSLWESINGLGSWDENPWVWVVEFRKAMTKG